MEIFFHKNFKKRYKKLRKNQQAQFKRRRDLFLADPFDPVLNNHPLAGDYKGYRSINISGDLRVLYEPIGKNKALFITIDTHSNLYK